MDIQQYNTSYNIHIEGFEGPFDLLLHLININEIDIYDIPISDITVQYLEYLDKMSELDMEIASSFLVMAAMLLELKSRMLLPWRQNDDESALSSNDPRTDLVIKLLAYKKYKHIARFLQDREQFSRHLSKPQGEIENYVITYENEILNADLDKQLLIKALSRLDLSAQRMDNNRKKYFKSLKRDRYTVNDQIEFIMDRLDSSGKLSFDSLFDTSSTKEEVIVTFLAILELLKQSVITVTQSDNFEDIFINKVQESESIGA